MGQHPRRCAHVPGHRPPSRRWLDLERCIFLNRHSVELKEAHRAYPIAFLQVLSSLRCIEERNSQVSPEGWINLSRRYKYAFEYVPAASRDQSKHVGRYCNVLSDHEDNRPARGHQDPSGGYLIVHP